MSNGLREVAAISIVIALTGCVRVAVEPPPATNERATVAWEDYLPSAKQIIDEDQAAKDCYELQAIFDVYENAGFVDVMEYVDEAMRLAGCYNDE